MDQIKKLTYVFCYGSNHPEQLSRRIGTPIVEILKRSASCTLPGWKRVYVGASRTWSGKSVANVMVDEMAECDGYCVNMTEEEIARLDPFEGYPVWYNRQKVLLKVHGPEGEDQMAEGLVYVMINPEMLGVFSDPAPEYLDACCKTLSTSLYLRQGHIEKETHRLQIEIVRGTDLQKHSQHEAHACIAFLNLL